MAKVHDIKTLDLSEGLTPELRNYIVAVRDGFFEPPVSEEGFQHWHHLVSTDRTRLRAVYDHDRPYGLADLPVATFASWDGTINTGRELAPTNNLTDVTVQASHRRRGLMNAMMTQDLEEARERGDVFSALTATDARLYSRFGFGVSATARKLEFNTGPGFEPATTSTGTVVFADPDQATAVRREIFDEFHAHQFWSIERPATYWTQGFDWSEMKHKPERAAIHLDEDGKADGVVQFRVEEDHLWIRDLLGLNIQAELELLRLLGLVEGVNKVVWPRCHNPRHPLTWALVDHRVVKTVAEYDTVWVRILDVVRALEARGFDNDGSATITVEDPLDDVSGTYRIEVVDGVASVERSTSGEGPLIPLTSLAALYSGLAHPFELQAAGAIQGGTEELASLGHLFAKDLPGIAAAIF